MHFPEGLEDTSLKSCKSHETIAMKLHSYVETNETKNIRILVFSFSFTNLAFSCFLFCFFHVVSKISNNMRTSKHLAKASCIESTLNVNFKH